MAVAAVDGISAPRMYRVRGSTADGFNNRLIPKNSFMYRIIIRGICVVFLNLRNFPFASIRYLQLCFFTSHFSLQEAS